MWKSIKIVVTSTAFKKAIAFILLMIAEALLSAEEAT